MDRAMTQLEKLQNRLNELPEDKREAMAAQVLDEWDALTYTADREKESPSARKRSLSSVVALQEDQGRSLVGAGGPKLPGTSHGRRRRLSLVLDRAA